jgi:CMP-N-acetylneuraminic acid synthetase
MYERSDEKLVPLRRDEPGRRQDFEPIYVRNGAIYVACRTLIMEENRLYAEEPLPFEMPRYRSINVDEPFDLTLANAIWEINGHDT